jgi:hypothetical protein
MRKYSYAPNFIVALVFYISIVSFSKCANMAMCAEEDHFKENGYSGIVIRKFLNDKNHRFRTLSLTGGDEMILVLDTTKLYDFVQPGDSIIKKRGSKEVFVKRNGKVVSYVVYFDCNR